MNKVLYNDCFGGFSLSDVAVAALKELGIDVDHDGGRDVSRHDPRVIAVVERLGLKACSGFCAQLAIAEISGDKYRIEEYDGAESVVEPFDLDWVLIGCNSTTI